MKKTKTQTKVARSYLQPTSSSSMKKSTKFTSFMHEESQGGFNWGSTIDTFSPDLKLRKAASSFWNIDTEKKLKETAVNTLSPGSVAKSSVLDRFLAPVSPPQHKGLKPPVYKQGKGGKPKVQRHKSPQ